MYYSQVKHKTKKNHKKKKKKCFYECKSKIEVMVALSCHFQGLSSSHMAGLVVVAQPVVSGFPLTIRKTCPCNGYPLVPHFNVVKLGFVGVSLIFLFLIQNIFVDALKCIWQSE